ncbi:MAG: hypothetical protein HC927_02420 [Deltaproteobacteria bacterium]|nr:hypothetical protein [Deltaproteobacteria bacterium]
MLAALGIGKSDLALLAASELTPALVGDPPGPEFSFANFTALFRCVSLARALRISIAELVRLAGTSSGLTGMDPFASPAGTLAFIDQIEALRDSDFSTNELDWLLRHRFTGLDPLDEATIGRELGTLARGLNTIEAEVEQLADPDGAALTLNLPELLEEADVTTTLAMVDRLSTLGLDQTQREQFIESTFAGILDVEAGKDVLAHYGNTDWADVVQRRAWLLARVVGHLRRRALIVDTIAAKFKIAATVVEALVDTVLSNPADGNEPLFEVFRLPFATEAEVATG